MTRVLVLLGLVVLERVLGYSGKEVELQAETKTLEFVHTIWRHGDRTPGALLFPEDRIKWPQGIGELTEKGIEQQYRLGQWFRKRYGSWLGYQFNTNSIYIRSSDYNRTLMSALANMAGLFPPEHEIAPNLKWRPVPVHTMPKHLDKELYEDIACPKAEEEMRNQWKSEIANKIRKEFENEIALFGKHLNRTNLDLESIWLIYDTFFCEKCNGVSWPNWLDSKLFDRLEDLYNQISRLEFHTETLRRLRGGTLLEEIFNRFTSKVNGSLGNEAKFFAYSAHDATIAALLSTFGIYYETFPKYATTLIIEMHRFSNSSLILKLFHKNETDLDKVFEYSIPGCESPCTLDKLKDDLSRYFPDDWNQECGISIRNGNSAFIALTIFFSCTTIALGALLIKEKRKNIPGRRSFGVRKNKKEDDIVPMLVHSDDEEI